MDWKEDLANSKYSLLLARALEHIAPEKRSVPPEQLRERIGRVIYYSGLAEEHLGDSFKWLERAWELSLAAGCAVWATHVEDASKSTVVLRADLRSIMSTQKSPA